MIKVWHINESRLLGEIDSWDQADPRYLDARMGMRDDGRQERAATELKKEGFYDLVALVDTDDLDVAWESTNHIDDSWTKNRGVQAQTENPRSSSPGDIFEKDTGESFVCASIGFRKLDAESAQAKPKKTAGPI